MTIVWTYGRQLDRIHVSQVRFALSSSPTFVRLDTVSDSERFYNTVLDLLEDIEEIEEVNKLLNWWNRSVT